MSNVSMCPCWRLRHRISNRPYCLILFTNGYRHILRFCLFLIDGQTIIKIYLGLVAKSPNFIQIWLRVQPNSCSFYPSSNIAGQAFLLIVNGPILHLSCEPASTEELHHLEGRIWTGRNWLNEICLQGVLHWPLPCGGRLSQKLMLLNQKHVGFETDLRWTWREDEQVAKMADERMRSILTETHHKVRNSSGMHTAIVTFGNVAVNGFEEGIQIC
jgi:hypothetical protein